MEWLPILAVLCAGYSSVDNIFKRNYEAAFWGGTTALWASVYLIPGVCK